MKYPKVVATKPPKPLSKSAPLLGKVAAVVMALFAIMQLAGVNYMIDSLYQQLSGSAVWVAAVVGVVLLSEIMSIPFLMRYKTSELARLASGFFAVLGPWVWLLVVIWSVGTEASAAQFGIFHGITVGWWLLALNGLWLVFNFYTVKQLGIEKTWRTLSDKVHELKKAKGKI